MQENPILAMLLCYLLRTYQLVSAKLNFDTFCDNGHHFTLHKARSPIFCVQVVHKYGYVISRGRYGSSSRSREIQLGISSAKLSNTL
jgi:hypothetical protein